MTINLRALALSATLTLIGTSFVAAQAPRPASPTSATRVAVLDVARVFKSHNGFTNRIEALKNEVKGFEEQVNRQQRSLVDQAKQLNKQYKPGTPDYQRVEGDLAKKESELRVRMQLKRKEVYQTEAKLYYETYQQIRSTVARIAEQNQVGLVLRYDSEPLDPSDRGKVQSGVNRFVVWQNRIDLTDMVIRQLTNQASRPR